VSEPGDLYPSESHSEGDKGIEGSERASPSESRGDEEGDDSSVDGTVVENESDNGSLYEASWREASVTVFLDDRIQSFETTEPTEPGDLQASKSDSEGDGSVDETVVGAGDPEEERGPAEINMRGDRTTGPRHAAHRRTKACDANDLTRPSPFI